MGISIDPTLPDRDWSEVGKPTAETVGHLLALSFGDAAGSAFDSIKAFRTRDETVGQKAWTLWRESLAIALPEFFVTAGLTRRPDDKELGRLLVAILKDSEVLAGKDGVELTAEDLRYPLGFALYKDVREKLPGWAREVAPDHLRDDDHLRRRLDRAFVKGFHRARFEGGSHFDEIRDYLFGDGSEASERRDHWLRYAEWLRAEVEDRPMFGQEAHGPTLQDIFVPLRCTWRERPRERHGRDEEGCDKRTVVHVRWLLDELKAWLAKADKKDVLRVVTGGPGCGKSSTAKVLSHEVARADRFNVLVVPLQGLDVSRDIDAVVSDYIEDARHNSSCLPESPINWVRHDPKPLLLIFDGLDEVARPDGAGLEVTRTFLESLRVWLGRVNGAGADLKVMALALGRPQAAEEAASKIGGLDSSCILYAEPLCMLDDERLKRSLNVEITVDDPDQLTDGDHRRQLWDGYARFDDRYRDVEPAVLEEGGLNDLTVEPLLLYLLMYSGLAGKDWPEAKENRNRIYEAIFSKVHERDRREKDGIAVDDREDFFTLMECLGLAAWTGGGRTGSDEDFEYIRDEIYAPDRRQAFRDLERAQLKNVAVQFYTHHGGRDDPGYAFVHKSFGEYLTARALVKVSEAWCEEYGKRNKWSSFAEDWLRLTGSRHITPEILIFMIDEARLQVKARSGDDPDLERARTLVGQLCEVVNLTLHDGFPAHQLLPASNSGATWRHRELHQRDAEMALYAVIQSWAEVGYPRGLINSDSAKGGWEAGPIKIKWPEPASTPAVAMISRVRAQWIDDSVASSLFARWDFGEEQNFGVIDLRYFDFFGANLTGANLFGADLSWANLSSAKLSDANLCFSRLGWQRNSVFASSFNLNSANLSGADLTSAKLHGADLSGTGLYEAKLGKADLSNANLIGARLRDADCSDTNLGWASLHGVDLSSVVNLSQRQIDKAQGNSETELPNDIQRPAHWSDED